MTNPTATLAYVMVDEDGVVTEVGVNSNHRGFTVHLMSGEQALWLPLEVAKTLLFSKVKISVEVVSDE